MNDFHENADGQVVCRHRDVSCCPVCLAADDRLVDVYGQVFFVPDPGDRAELAKGMAS